MTRHACCAPGRSSAPPGHSDGEGGRPPLSAASPGVPYPRGGWRELDGGSFLMGCGNGPYPADGEGPVREVAPAPFRLRRGLSARQRYEMAAHSLLYGFM